MCVCVCVCVCVAAAYCTCTRMCVLFIYHRALTVLICLFVCFNSFNSYGIATLVYLRGSTKASLMLKVSIPSSASTCQKTTKGSLLQPLADLLW